MAHSDKPRICPVRLCLGLTASYRMPSKFLNGGPKWLTLADFRGRNPVAPRPAIDQGAQTPPRDDTDTDGDDAKAVRTCECVKASKQCTAAQAAETYGCQEKKRRRKQPNECKKACCDFCKSSENAACDIPKHRRICKGL